MNTRPDHVDLASRLLTAMAHPARRDLLEVLAEHGPATVSILATRTHQAVGNTSHHLKVLADAELIRTDPARAKNRREHWWRLTGRALGAESSAFGGHPAAVVISTAAAAIEAAPRRAGEPSPAHGTTSR